MRESDIELLTRCEELGIGIFFWAPLGQGFLTGQITPATKSYSRSVIFIIAISGWPMQSWGARNAGTKNIRGEQRYAFDDTGPAVPGLKRSQRPRQRRHIVARRRARRTAATETAGLTGTARRRTDPQRQPAHADGVSGLPGPRGPDRGHHLPRRRLRIPVLHARRPSVRTVAVQPGRDRLRAQIPAVRLRPSRAIAGRAAGDPPGALPGRAVRRGPRPHRRHGKLGRRPPGGQRGHPVRPGGRPRRRRARRRQRTAGLRHADVSRHCDGSAGRAPRLAQRPARRGPVRATGAADVGRAAGQLANPAHAADPFPGRRPGAGREQHPLLPGPDPRPRTGRDDGVRARRTWHGDARRPGHRFELAAARRRMAARPQVDPLATHPHTNTGAHMIKHHPAPMRHKALAVSISMLVLGAAATAQGAPIATLDRNCAWVSVEAYGPNVVRVTIAADKAEALKGAGYGILPGGVDNAAFRHSGGKDGDTFSSPALSLHVAPAPAPHVPSMSEKYFASILAPVALQVKNAKEIGRAH